MQILRDLYTQVEYSPVQSSSVTLGQTIIQYEVRAYTDTRNLTETKSYLVSCSQRLILANPVPYNPKAQTTTNFLNYPALLTNQIAISDPNGIIKTQVLLEYAPQTLNTAVASSQSSAQSSNTTVSQQYTSGSSTAQTNSYGGSVSLGFFGDAPTGDISANYQHSSTKERSSSLSKGNAVDSGNQVSNSSSMTIKDWGSYAAVDSQNHSITWVWGQEYPWNVIQFKNQNAAGTIALPAYVAQRLYDGTSIYPPSELSLFGVNFVAKATWLITPNAASATPEEITFNHTLTYGAGSHSVTGNVLTVGLDTYLPIVYTSSTLDLALLALDPIQSSDRGPAVIGFVPNQFDVAPGPGGQAFAITAADNNLLVRGSGFNGVMTTNFSTGAVQMTISFKIVDGTRDFSLSLKHWVASAAAPCQLSIVVNGSAPILRFVDAPETGSGGDNVTVVALRNGNFASVDYCNYLQMGLNTVTVAITPVNGQTPTAYQLMALAVG